MLVPSTISGQVFLAPISENKCNGLSSSKLASKFIIQDLQQYTAFPELIF